MRASQFFATAPVFILSALAYPHTVERLTARQSNAPPPCVRQDPAPSATETEAKFDDFAQAFLVEKNLTRAFTFIAEDYINHNPYVSANGSAAAFSTLEPIWSTVDITVLRTRYIDPQGFLNYNATGVGEVVDRFRWEGGCIVEHWDAGEVFPVDNNTSS